MRNQNETTAVLGNHLHSYVVHGVHNYKLPVSTDKGMAI